MVIFLLSGRGEALVHATPNVIKHNSEDSGDFFSADFRNFSFDCLAHSEPRHQGEASFVAWLCARFHVQRLPMPIDVRDRTVYAVPVSAIKEERVSSVEYGNADQCSA
jgi:hypothetical protein